MFGIGPTEMVVVAVLFLIIFGPSKMPQMARDIGKFVGQARGAIDEFKDELTAEELDDDRPARSREEGSRRRKNNRNGASGSSRKDERLDEEEDPEDSSSENKSREPAEYDL